MTRKLPPSIPITSGRYAKQAHVGLPENTFEEEHGRQGFFGRVSHLYRTHAPTGWSRIEGELQPRAYDLNQTIHLCKDRPLPILGNSDVQIWLYAPQKNMPYYQKNGDGDEVWFIHSGSGRLETDYGPLQYRKGDYIVIPRGTAYRFFPADKLNNFYLLIESFSEVTIPDRGPLGRHAFYDPGVIEYPQAKPSEEPATDGTEWKLVVKRNQQFTSIFYPHNPLDVEGWKGDLFPWRLNVEDIRPIVSPRYHLPPSVHTTLMGDGFVLCTFAPRPTETEDPAALKVPFFHQNIDYDEVIFYHDGDFFSRSGITPGMITFHPVGIHHGPHPSALANQHQKKYLQEYAVMIDTSKALHPLQLATHCEIPEYKDSWKPKDAQK